MMTPLKTHTSTITSWFAAAAMAISAGCAPTHEDGAYMDAEKDALEAESALDEGADDSEHEKLYKTKTCAPGKTDRYAIWSVSVNIGFKPGKKRCPLQLSVNDRWKGFRSVKDFYHGRTFEKFSVSIRKNQKVCIHYSPSCLVADNVELWRM